MTMEQVTMAAMVAQARTRVEGLSPTEVSAALDGETLLVDVRERDEVERDGFLPGAVFAPRGLLELWVDLDSPDHRQEFYPARRIILYCDTGIRAALAADTMRRMGYWRTAYLEEGLEAWVGEGRATGGSEKEREGDRK
ncbi:MAG: rhodanese-like domain-containing protein [Acidimicrobiia bacterium]